MTPPCTIVHRVLATCIATMLLVSGGGLTGASVLCLSMDGHVKIEAMRSTCCEPEISPASSTPTPRASNAAHCASCTDLVVSQAAHKRKQAHVDGRGTGSHGLAAAALNVNGAQPSVAAHSPASGPVPSQRSPVSDIVQLI